MPQPRSPALEEQRPCHIDDPKPDDHPEEVNRGQRQVQPDSTQDRRREDTAHEDARYENVNRPPETTPMCVEVGGQHRRQG